jgi:Zn-finger nucleic acid-binding protein
MDCPVCKDTKLVMTERQNIEIDYCPNCRGVWLDRGELDKIIERSQMLEFPNSMMQKPQPQSFLDTSVGAWTTSASNVGQPKHGPYEENQFGNSSQQPRSEHRRDYDHEHSQGGFLRKLFD